MAESSQAENLLGKWNDRGQLDTVVGITTVILAWMLMPIIGLFSPWFGYRLHQNHNKTVLGVVIAILGIVAVIIWLLWLYEVI